MKSLIRALTLAASLLLAPLAPAAMTNNLVGFVYQAAVPVGIPSSGTMGNNGALSAITTLPTTYPAIWLFFPTNAICTAGTGGNAAGLYYVQMSSATAGTVFNNTLVAGARPTVLGSPTAFACTGPGAYTQSIASQTLVSFTVSGGYLGVAGAVQIYDLFSLNNSANGKIFNITYGGTAVQTSNLTAINSYENLLWVYNTGQQNRQVLSPTNPTAFGGTTTANTFLAIDTSANFNIVVNATVTNATDYVVLEALTIIGQTAYN